MKQIAIMFILLTILAACSSADGEPPTTTPAPTPSATDLPEALPVEDRLAIEANSEQLRQLHVELSNIWEALARGETAQCGTDFDIPAPGSFLIAGEMSQPLDIAASDLRAAANRWSAECANPRANVPQESIEQGLLEVRAAGDALREVENFLAEN